MSGIIDINSYINRTINNFKIIKFLYFKNYNRSRQPYYEVICTNCSKTSNMGLWSIKRERKYRCRHCKVHHCQLPDGEASINALFSLYKRGAKERNYKFGLTKKYFISLINGNCYYCNAKPSNKFINSNNTGQLIYNGIDRVNNMEGYILGNVVSCCKRCNRAKSDMTYSEFINWIKNICKNITCVNCE